MNDPSGDPRRWRVGANRRAQAELVGMVLVVALVVLGSVLIGVLGSAALDSNERAVALTHAEQSMTHLDASASAAALFDDGRARVALGPENGGSVSTVQRSWLRVQFVDPTTGNVTATVVNQSLGAVVYRRGQATVAYEGGGVWRSERNGDGSVMVSAPEFHFRNDTLTLPVVSLRGDPVLGQQVTVERNGSAQRRYPDASRGLVNRVNDVRATVTVHSDYYRAWGRYFEQATASRVRYDDGNRTATVTFLALPKVLHLRSGVVSTAGSGSLELHGDGAYTDSYDARVGPYDVSHSGGGSVEAVGDVDMFGNSSVRGDIHAGGHVNFTGGPSVFGGIYWTDPPAPDPGKVDGETSITRISGVPTVYPLDAAIYDTVDRVRTRNDNSQAGSLVSDGSISVGPGKGKTHVLTSGRYYVDTLDVSGGTLTLDTTDGDVTLAVNDWMRVDNGGTIRVTGNGTAHVYLASRHEVTVSGTGAGSDEVNLYLGRGATVRTPGQNASQLRLFAPQDFRAIIAANKGNRVSFDGLVYAPAGPTGSGSVYVKQGDVYGGVVAGSVTLGQNGAVHYDRALGDVALTRAPGVARLRYLHVTVHRLNVSDR